MNFPCCGGNDETPKDHTMDCDRPFKVMQLSQREYAGKQVRTVPWSFILQAGVGADRSDRVQKNHMQSLETLNRRGGLSPKEIWAIYYDKGWRGKDSMDHFNVTESSCAIWLHQEMEKLNGA